MNKDKVMAMIKRKSEESGVSVNTLLLLYFFERFLEGLAESAYMTDLILKGGFLLSSIMGIDIATGDPITPGAGEYCYKSVFDESKEIKVLSYNLETMIAEKMETLVSRKTDNSRSKDFYDLYIILTLREEKIDKTVLLQALTNTFDYRLTPFDFDGIIADLEDIREDAGFRKRWRLYCKKNAYVGNVDFDQVISTLEAKIKTLRQV